MKDITGLLIKENREKLGLKQEYLCKGICSISYLSKIERGNIVASEEIVKMLFKKLGIDFNSDEKFVQEGKQIFEEINKSRYFGTPIDEHRLEEIRSNKSRYLNSSLNIDYQLFELFDKLFQTEDTDILRYKEYMDNDQLYMSYLITGFLNNDIKLLEEAKKVKYTAEIIHQIAYIKWIEGKYYESIELNLEALNLAYNEGCIKLQIEVCVMLGNLYIYFHLPTMEKYYNKALNFLNLIEDRGSKFFIYYHMGIAYISIDFIKAEEYLLKAMEISPEDNKDSMEKLYQKLCFLYLRYNKKEIAKIYYIEAKKINILKSVNELIEIMIENEDYIHSEKYLNKLMDIYNESKKNRQHSNTTFYSDFLIEAYKANRRYKDALLVTEYIYRNQR